MSTEAAEAGSPRRTSPPELCADQIALASFPRSGNSLLRSLIEKVRSPPLICSLVQPGCFERTWPPCLPACANQVIILSSSVPGYECVGWVRVCHILCMWWRFLFLVCLQFTGFPTGSDYMKTTLLSRDLREMGFEGSGFCLKLSLLASCPRC